MKEHTVIKKILYIFEASDWKSRLPVAIIAREDGFDVVLGMIGEVPKDFPASGFKIEKIPAPEHKLSPHGFAEMVGLLRRLIGRVEPDILHVVTLKYAFMAGLADMAYPYTRRVYTLAGLGYLFRDNSRKAQILLAGLSFFLKMVLKNKRTTLIFQNPDDKKLMIDAGFANAQRSILIRGSGVNLKTFLPTPVPNDGFPIVLMPTRLVHEKGIGIFVEAANILKTRGTKARFQIAGGLTKHNPKAINEEDMKEYLSGGNVEWLGRVDDMPGLLMQASVIAYPSYYGEGVPRVLLEACAAGRPIVTTDHTGCREAVRHGENGFLVPIKDGPATAKAIEKLLNDPTLREAMGQKSRALAENEFDIRQIARQTCDIYKQVLQI